MRERIAQFIADHLPRRVVYLVGIRMWAAGTTGMHSSTVAPALTMDEALRRWAA